MFKSNLEIHLIDRWLPTGQGSERRVFVLGVRDSTDSSGRCVITTGEDLGDTIFHRHVENYYITSLIWTLEDTQEIIESENFDTSPESQNHAFEMIREVAKCEGSSLTYGKEDSRMSGPKRIEIEFQQVGTLHKGIGFTHRAKEKKRVVAVTYLRPSGVWSHTIRGRVWDPSHPSETLGRTQESFHSDKWSIARVEIYTGGNTSSMSSFGDRAQEKAWSRVQNFFDRGFTDAEKLVLERWEPALSSDDEMDYCGYLGSNYYGYAPSVYEPPVADYRVSGDEIGAQIHLEQMERAVKNGDFTAKGVLAFAAKKKDVESPGEENKTLEASTSEGGGDDRDLCCPLCGFPHRDGSCNVHGAALPLFPFVSLSPEKVIH